MNNKAWNINNEIVENKQQTRVNNQQTRANKQQKRKKQKLVDSTQAV